MNTKSNVTEHWKTYVSVFWTYALWFERSVPATRTRRCRFSSSCDLSLYRTVERRVLSGEDNRKSFLVEEKTEEIWSLSSHLQPSAFLLKKENSYWFGGKNWGSGLEEIVSLFNTVFASVDLSIRCLLDCSVSLFHFSSCLVKCFISFCFARHSCPCSSEGEIYKLTLFVTRLERVNTKVVLHYWILEFL
jgi:hypothetical protein